MTLMRFLAVGKSLGGVGTEPSRYRMNAQGMLPKFGREGARPAPAPVTAAPAVTSLPPAITKAAKATSFLGTPMTKHSIAVQSRSQRSGGAKFWGPWTRLKDKFTSNGGAARVAGPPVQAELALDMVRPVRNDLSDSDFEILAPAKRKVAAPVQPMLATTAMKQNDPGANLLWGRVRSRLFGARQA